MNNEKGIISQSHNLFGNEMKHWVDTRYKGLLHCLHSLLGLAVWVASFAGVWADGTRPESEFLIRIENMGDSDLCPVPPSGGIAVVEFCPEEEFTSPTGVRQELWFGQSKWLCVVAKARIIGKNNESLSTPIPSLRFLGKGPNGNDSWCGIHQPDVECRSLAHVLDEEAHSELFFLFGLPIHPYRLGILSGLNFVHVVTQPCSLFQTHRIHGSMRLFFHGGDLPTGKLSTSNGRSSSLFGSVRSSLRSTGLLLHFPQGIGELLRVVIECISSYFQSFSGQSSLIPSVVSIEERHSYKEAGRNSNGSIWPLFLGFLVASTINIIGSYLIFFTAIRPRIVNWRMLVFGIFLIFAGGFGLHHVLPQLDERLWEMTKRVVDTALIASTNITFNIPHPNEFS